jgi:hypothetical protein
MYAGQRFHRKNDADEGVWLKDRAVGATVRRHPCDKTASTVAFDNLTAESEKTDRAKAGYRPHHKKVSLSIQNPVEERWTR